MRPPVSVTIDGLNPDGIATGLDARGRRWTVPGAPLGGTVLAVGRLKHARVVSVVSLAPDAVTPRCAQFGTCGGCRLQSSPIERQRAEKRAALSFLAPLGGRDHGIVGAEAYAYRNKVELSFGTKRYLDDAAFAAGDPMGGRFCGMHAPGRFDRIVDAPRCELVSEAMNAVLANVRRDALSSPWEPWDARAHTGFWRHLVLREGTNGVFAAIHTWPGTDEQAAWLRSRAASWGAAGVLWFENDRPADAAIGTLREVLHGVHRIEERLGGVSFRLSPTAFFQVNVAGAELLCRAVAEAAGSGSTLIDLYCGTGALGLCCGGAFERVIGIDSNAASIEDARINAAHNGISAEFHAGEVEAVIGSLSLPGRPAVIVDPPRVGLHPKALAFVAGMDAAVLVYVACRPTSLLRDGRVLQAAGWECTDRWAVDLFPQTGHVEVVSRWTRGPSRTYSGIPTVFPAS